MPRTLATGRTLVSNRDVLPTTNYVTNAGTLFEDFETIGDWTKGSSGSIATNSLHKTGSSSLMLTSASGGNCYATKTISSNFLSNWGFGIWVYITDKTTLSAITLYFSSNSGLTQYMSYSISDGNTGLFNGWNYLTIPKPDASVTGGDTWNNTKIRLRVRIDAVASRVAVVYFDSLYVDKMARPKLLITFDDGWDSQYSQAYAYMSTKGLLGTIYLETDNVNQTNYLTDAQIAEMYNAGWDIGVHGHYDLTTLANQQAMEDDVAYNKSYQITNGLTRAIAHYAYPLGGYNDTAIAAVTAQGMLTARTTISGGSIYQPTAAGIFNPYTLKEQSILNTTTLSQAQTKVDLSRRSMGTIILNFHKIVASPSAQIEWDIPSFQALMDYIKLEVDNGYLDVVTISGWYNGLNYIGARHT
jgi:peptidoglycan/xylan/chitin deacetylase (PgdA/CDA1 family)